MSTTRLSALGPAISSTASQRCRQPLAVCHSRYQVQLLSGQFVTAGDELATRLFEGLDVFERADLVVLTRDRPRAARRDWKCVLPEGRSTAPAWRQARRCAPRSPARRDCRRDIAGSRARRRRSARVPGGSAARRTSGTAGYGRCRRSPDSAPASRRSAAPVPRPPHWSKRMGTSSAVSQRPSSAVITGTWFSMRCNARNSR